MIAVSFSSCEGLLDDCEVCRYNVYEDGIKNDNLTYGELEYCDTDLIARKAAPDITVGTTVTRFECD